MNWLKALFAGQSALSQQDLITQQQLHGERDTPPAILNGISSTRQEIQRIKSMLRTWNEPVTDRADDEHGA